MAEQGIAPKSLSLFRTRERLVSSADGALVLGGGARRARDGASAEGVGQLLITEGRFSGDIDLPRQARGQVLHSPYSHADIRTIDALVTKAARGGSRLAHGHGRHGR